MARVTMEKVMILGLGGGGGKIVRTLAARAPGDWVDFVYADTDVADLDFQDGILHLPLGREWTHGMSTGGDVHIGRHAISANVDELRDLLRAPDLLIVVGCLGGGTASGGAQVLATLAREEQKLCFFLVTLPFAFEGNTRGQVAERELEGLRQHCDVVVALRNDLLFTHFNADTPVDEAFTLANELLADGLLGLASIIRCKGMLPLDFASLRAVLKRRQSYCSFGIGYASGEGRGQAVIEDLFASPLLGGRDAVKGADAVVASLLGGQDLRIGELNECLQTLNGQLGAQTRTVIGAATGGDSAERLQLTMLAIQYSSAEPRPERPPKPAKATKTTARNNDDDRQGTLPFVEENLTVGIFGDCEPTMYNGENLDIPTFRRRGRRLDLDD